SAGCVYSLRRRAKGVSGSHRGDISKGAGSAVHRAFDAQQSKLRQPQRTQNRGGGVEGDLQCAGGGSGGTGIESFRRKTRRSLPCDCVDVAAELGSDHAVLCVCAGGAQSHLYHQRDRIAQPVMSQNHQNPRSISQRSSGGEADLPGVEECHGAMAQEPREPLEGSAEPVHCVVGRPNSCRGGGGTHTMNDAMVCSTENERLSLKESSGWFAAGASFRRALTVLSDGAFRLFALICLEADRQTGCFAASYSNLAKALGKSKRAIGGYVAELENTAVCQITAAGNQHGRNLFQILDEVWPNPRNRAGQPPAY